MGVRKHNYFQIGDVSSLDFGIVISEASVWGSPKRVYEEVSVPGRNGVVLFDQGYYENVPVSYNCQILDSGGKVDQFRAWLASQLGYVKLEDTYHPEEYRLAKVDDGLSPRMSLWALKRGDFNVQFSAKPQRFLKIGDVGTEYDNNFTIFNPTYYEAQPIIRVYGYGTLTVGNTTVTITQNALPYIDIDSAVMDCYHEGDNANQYVALSSEKYPALGVGATAITLSSNIPKIILFPKWYTM